LPALIHLHTIKYIGFVSIKIKHSEESVDLLSLDASAHVQAAALAGEVRVPELRALIGVVLHALADIASFLHTVVLLHAVIERLRDIFAGLISGEER
jgi:hypothetical protein